MNHIAIAIDGPAGAGKSTISKLIASQLNYVYIDTGAMYRAIGLKALEQSLNTREDIAPLIAMLRSTKLEIIPSPQGQRVILDGRDVTALIRTPEVSVAASDVSAIPEVRLALVELQRELAQNNNVIMDGRDIGTYVLPNAQIKLFLTASAHDRATRRYQELIEKGIPCGFEEVKRDMEYRDYNDANREFAPLKPAEDAIIVDTSGKELERSLQLVSDLIKERLSCFSV